MAIQVFNSKSMPGKPLHTFVYGALRTGKTTFAATFPKPIFLSAGNEGGDTTLRFCDADIIRISSVEDMKQAIPHVVNNRQKMGWRTLVIDSLTYYSDVFVQQITNKDNSGDTKPMRTQDWGLLDLHLQKWLLPTLMNVPMHVVWIALEEVERGTEGEIRGYQPMLYGKTKAKLPGACDLIVRSVVQQTRVNNVLTPKFVLRTITAEGAPAGGRFGNAFADGTIPAHFGAIVQRIGPYIGEDPAAWQPTG